MRSFPDNLNNKDYLSTRISHGLDLKGPSVTAYTACSTALAAPGGDIGIGTEYAAPTDEIEETLANMWCEILVKNRVGSDDNFFDLGGQSLKAIFSRWAPSGELPGLNLRKKREESERFRVSYKVYEC